MMTKYNSRTASTTDEKQIVIDNMKLLPVDKRKILVDFFKKKIVLNETNYSSIMALLIKVEYIIRLVPSQVDLAAAYKKNGLSVRTPNGQCWHSKTMVAAPHDNVQYCIDTHENNEDQAIRKGIRYRKMIIDRYHWRIKQIYDYLVSLNIGDIWVMVGGGCQMQVFFGYSEGYLAILSLDLDNGVDTVSKILAEVLKTKNFTLEVQYTCNNQYFETISFDNITIKLSSYH